MKPVAILGAATLIGLGMPAAPVAAQGIGCEVILCLAGGFPGPDCSPAKSYFKKALRKDFNPFKPCKKASASGVVGDYDVPTNWYSRSYTSCPGGYVTSYGRDSGTYCSGGIQRWTEHGVSITIPLADNPAASIPGYTPTPVNIPGVDLTSDKTFTYVYARYRDYTGDK